MLSEDWGASLTSRPRALPDRQGYQPVAPAHDRGHDDPQASADDATYPTSTPSGISASSLVARRTRRARRTCGAITCIWPPSGVPVASQNARVTALRFFFTVTLGRSRVTERMPFVREPRKLPVVLNRRRSRACWSYARPQVPSGAEVNLTKARYGAFEDLEDAPVRSSPWRGPVAMPSEALACIAGSRGVEGAAMARLQEPHATPAQQ